jgi:hypothetical protein
MICGIRYSIYDRCWTGCNRNSHGACGLASNSVHVRLSYGSATSLPDISAQSVAAKANRNGDGRCINR